MHKQTGMNAEQYFTLTLDPAKQRLVLSRSNGTAGKNRRMAYVEREQFTRFLPQIRRLLNNSGFKWQRLDGDKIARVRMREADGARLAILLQAILPVRKPARVRLVQEGIVSMSDEEVYYWSSRIISRGNDALKALRILLAGE